MLHAHNFAQALRLCPKCRMPKETADEKRRLAVVKIKPHQTVSPMPQRRLGEVLVVSEKRWVAEPKQKRNDVRILNSGSGEFPAYTPELDSPFPQNVFLILPDIFIQQIHAATWPLSDRASRPRASSNAPRASAMVSNIAALLTRPPHALTI
jgi:hypothetical protein